MVQHLPFGFVGVFAARINQAEGGTTASLHGNNLLTATAHQQT
nr:hypothetical protein AUSP0112_00019 [uncultured phage]